MSPDYKLAQIARSLKDAGIEALVMGGHAVRYYGIDLIQVLLIQNWISFY